MLLTRQRKTEMEHLSYARAKLVILGELSDHRKLSGTHGRELFSPGLWGIESDSGDWYFEQVYQEERDILLATLGSLKTYEIRA